MHNSFDKFQGGKIFNDPVHGHIELHPICVKIVDTQHFQRLRQISQLGGVYYVFPGASHNRFEHSLGVCHLANLMTQQLQRCTSKLQQNEQITEADALCVQIAGLCHDLGHGIWSHLYDQIFKRQLTLGAEKVWQHEHASIAMFEAALEDNGGALYEEMKSQPYNLTDEDIHFIKELILGSEKEARKAGFTWRGRGAKSYLYEIVANKRNGVDVDKFDYFSRDCHHLGISKSFDALRLLRLARVYRDNDELRICYPYKEAWNVYELFHTRYNLHKRAYQHRVAMAVELMLADALVAANPHYMIQGKNGSEHTLASCVNDMEAYIKVTDHVISAIEFSSDQKLEPARKILQRIRKRQFYKMAYETLLLANITEEAVLNGQAATVYLIEFGQSLRASKNFDKQDFYVCSVKINYGLGEKDPVRLVCFYNDKEKGINNCPNVGAMPLGSVSRFVPVTFQEIYLRLYIKTADKELSVKQGFREWCESTGLPAEAPLTPRKTKEADEKKATNPKRKRNIDDELAV